MGDFWNSPCSCACLLQYSWLFFLSRGVVGTGSASYSTIAPTILGDLFVSDQRTRVLAIFYIFIPVGRLVSPWVYFPGLVNQDPKESEQRLGRGRPGVLAFKSQLYPFLTRPLSLPAPRFLICK